MQAVIGALSGWSFWIGVILAPFFWYMAYQAIKFVASQTKAWRKFFRGLPIVQYPFMWMICIGVKFIERKHCNFMVYENRWWFSPKVKGFDAPANITDQRF